MRNLVLIDKNEVKLPIHIIQTFIIDTSVERFANEIEPPDDQIFVCTNTNLYSFKSEINKLKELVKFYRLECKIIGIEHLIFNKEICYVFDNGEVWTYDLEVDVGEMAVKCDDEIEAVSWSADQEVIVFVTKSKKMVLMSRHYDLMYETNLDDASFGDQEFITVGWGKKETQFHGSEGKVAALKKDENVSITTSPNEVDKSINITWRGDGEFYAISFYGNSGRMFKVFNKDGILQYTSEKTNGLESVISWKPSGLWLAIPQVLPNKYIIALFEKNGLKHRELNLPFKNEDEKVIDLSWSLDSEVLSIVTLNRQTNKSSLYLYTINNYHWYQKQHLIFDSKVIHHQWCNENHALNIKSKSMKIILENSIFLLYQWDFKVASTQTHYVQDESVVGVIDGVNLLLTNFRDTITPPPMCGFTLKHEHSINFIDFLKEINLHENNNPNHFYILDSTNKLIFLKCVFSESKVKRILGVEKLLEFSMDSLVENNCNKTPIFSYHLVWLSLNRFLFYNKNQLYSYELSFSNQNLIKLKEYDSMDRVLNLTNIDLNTVLIGTSESVDKLDLSIDDAQETVLDFFEENYDQIRYYNEDNIVFFKNRDIIKINSEKITKLYVTSYYIIEKYLLFTTHDTLNFYDFKKKKVVYERKIETGARIIIVVPKTSKTILQLPRGNLETIEPRVLSVSIIGIMLDNLEYNNAFDLLRKQRINLNLIVDHNYNLFVSNLNHFLNEITNVNWLNLFLSELQNENVTRTMYNSNYEEAEMSSKNLQNNATINKVHEICSLLCDLMIAKGENKFMLPIITSYVKRKNIEKALNVIWVSKQNEVTNALKTTSADDALKYLICLVDVNELFKIALGMYDFNLVMFVANKSQKDPKEYLPFLNELKSIEDEYYRKYKIDLHLKRYEIALINLTKCNNDDIYLPELIDLIQKHELYAKGLTLLDVDSKFYKEIALIYGNFLREKGSLKINFLQASIMYERGGDLKQAILSSKHILEWRRCANLMRKNKSTDAEIREFLLSLIPALEDAKQYKDAVDILLKYDKIDIKYPIKLLLDGGYYNEANHLVLSYEYEDLNYEDVIRNPLRNTTDSAVLFICENLKQFIAYKSRLLIVRENRKSFPSGGFGETEYDVDDVSSVTSFNSKATGRSSKSGKSTTSSKNRRKQERKLLSLKEGNPFEEIALVDALDNLMTILIDHKNKITELSSVLIENGLDQLGGLLQETYLNVMNTIKYSLDQIYVPDMEIPKPTDLTNYIDVQKEKYYSMLRPILRTKPKPNLIFTEFDVLKNIIDFNRSECNKL